MSDWEYVDDNDSGWEYVDEQSANDQQQPEQPQSFADKMENFYRASGIHGANRGFAKVFGFGPHQQQTQQRYEQALETNPFATEAGNIGSQIASAVPFSMLAGMIPGLAGSGLAKNALKLGLGGATKAGIETPYGDETRLGNMATEGLESAAAPVVLHGAGKILKAGAKVGKEALTPFNYSKTKIANKIDKSFGDLKGKYNKLYEGLFDAAEQEGISTNLPGSDLPENAMRKIIKKSMRGIDSDVRESIEKAFSTNSPRNVHEAQSTLGEYIRNETKIKQRGGSIDRNALNRAKKLQKEMKKELEMALERSESGLGNQYKDVSSGYKKEVVPYSRNAAIQEFAAGESVPQDLIKALRGGGKSGKAFRKFLAEEHPEVKYNKIIEDAIKIGLGGSGLGGAGTIGYKLFGGGK